jgi:hypothetical protein
MFTMKRDNLTQQNGGETLFNLLKKKKMGELRNDCEPNTLSIDDLTLSNIEAN